MKRGFTVGVEDDAFLREAMKPYLYSTWDPWTVLIYPPPSPEGAILSKASIREYLVGGVREALPEVMTSATCILRQLGGEKVQKQTTARGLYFLQLFLGWKLNGLKSYHRPAGFYDSEFYTMPSVMGWMFSVILNGIAGECLKVWLRDTIDELYDNQPKPFYPEY